MPLFYEVSVHSVHITIDFGEFEFLFLFFCLRFMRRTVLLRLYRISEQALYSVDKIHTIKILHELYRSAACLILMVEPPVS